MCAIGGVLGLYWNEKTKDNMIATMTRRGPDATGVYEDRECMLLHARLAVIDPVGGAQPMRLNWAGEGYTIVYNGELYNAGALRRVLLGLGHRFLGHSDTEVLLHAYAQWGDGCLQKCNGIFAFAVWEEKSRKLFLARDRMGVKPLFYAQVAEGLLFASEIKTILAHGALRPVLDEQGAAEILLLGPGRTPGCGVLRGIHEVKPGYCGYFSDGKLHLQQYWKLMDAEHRDDLDQTVEKVRWLVTDAIRAQTVSDVPLGTFLSGGLDSSLITAICAKELERKGQKLHTFSVDYADNDKYFVPNHFQPNSDGHYIRTMQSALNTEHHWCVLSPEDLVEALEESVLARDLPGMGDVDISLLAFCKTIKNDVTVALSGECADEIFGGYPWYRDPEILSQNGFPWAQNIRERCLFLDPALREKLDGEAYVRSRYEATCRESDILPGTPPEERRMKEMVNLNQQWFMQTLLDRKDRMSMYSGLEVRVPFCDHWIAEYLYSVPWKYKDLDGKEKGLLRRAMEGVIPQEVLWRKKSPYPKTWHPKYLELVSGRLKDILAQKDAPLFCLVDKKAAKALLDAELPVPWYGQLMRRPQTICYLLQIDAWLRNNAVALEL